MGTLAPFKPHSDINSFIRFILLVITSTLIVNHHYASSSEANDQYYASRPIFPLKSYRDITMFHYTIPDEVVSARWTIWSNSTLNCDSKEVILLLRWHGYPLIPALHNASASKDVLIDLTEQYEISFRTDESRSPTFTLTQPLPGQWFGIGYLKHSSNRIVQRGLHQKCRVSLSTRLSLVKVNHDEAAKLITSESTTIYRLQDRKLFKFHIPMFANGAKLIISGCSRTASSPSSSPLTSPSKIDRDETDDEDLIGGAGSGAGVGSSNIGGNMINGAGGGVRRRTGEGCPIKVYSRTLGLPSDRLYDYHIDCSANLSDDCTASGFNYTQESWNYILLVRKPSRDDNTPVEFAISVKTDQCPNIKTSSQSSSQSQPLMKSQFAALLSADLAATSNPTISSSSSPSSPAPQFFSSALPPSSSVTSDPLTVLNGLLPESISSPKSSPSPPKSIGTMITKDKKQSIAFSNNNQDPAFRSSSNNPRWFHSHLLKTDETVSCPFRIDLIRYNLHGSFSFQYDYFDAFKTKSGHFTYSPFVDIPNSMRIPSENNPSSSPSSSLSMDNDLTTKEPILSNERGTGKRRNNLPLPKFKNGQPQRTYNLTELSVLHFQIYPILDSGGTLSIDLGLNPLTVNMSEQNVTLSGCLQQGHYSTNLETCRYPMKVNSSHNPLVTLNIPYPRAGLWFISIKSDCYKFDGRAHKPDPCRSNVTSIIMNIKSFPCFEDQCGPHGKCNQFISGGLIFSTCICNSGWKGLDCKDGTDALDEREILINFLLLTLSNLVFVPALILALYRRLFTEAFIYLIAMSSSILYHACDSDSHQAFCLVKLNILQYVDFYSALLAFWVTLISLSNLPIKARSFFHLVGSVCLAIGVQYDRTSLWTFVIPVSSGFIIVILTWCTFCCIKRNCFPSCQLWSLSMVPGLVMTTSGLAIYSLFETKDNYPIVHSFWHAVMASALLFLIPTMERKVNSKAKPSADEEDENFRGKGINHETYYELIAEEGSHLARHPLN